MTQRNVNLSEEQDRFITEKVASGQYQSASEVVREAVRQMQARDQERAVWLEHLRVLAAERFAALDRGESRELDSIEGFMDGVRAHRSRRSPDE